MVPVVLLVAVLQTQGCTADAAAYVQAATRMVDAFDLADAASGFELAALRGCEPARVAAIYLRGLFDAREAARAGGSPESLAPVLRAQAALASLGDGAASPAAIAHRAISHSQGMERRMTS